MSRAGLAAEPFRLLFPLGAVIGCVGLAPWIGFGFGLSDVYPGDLHRAVLTRAFLMCFAMGFLLTALPRRTSSPPASRVTLVLALGLPALGTAAAFAGRPRALDAAYAGMHLLLALFAGRRLVRGFAARPPPASFVLVPVGAVAGALAGAWLAVAAEPHAMPALLARRVVEQGVFLCWLVGVAALFLPLISGRTPAADLGRPGGEPWRAMAYAGVGLGILASLALELAGFPRLAPILRGGLVGGGLILGAGLLRRPGRPGLQRLLLWLALWCAPAGLIASGLWPAHRVDLLHLTFIGGFSLAALAVGAHVSFGHLDREDLATGRPLSIVALGLGLLVAAATRVVAPFTHSFALHLGVAASFWIVGALSWLGIVGGAMFAARRVE